MSRILRWSSAAGVLVLMVRVSDPAASSNQQRNADTLETVLEFAAASVRRLERELAAIVAEEHFTQRAAKRRTSDTLSSDARRETRSDLLLVRVAGEEGWLPFRDVYEVDGRAVRDRSERLQKLFLEAPETALTAAARITNESSRYNLEPVTRTINTPTFGLMLLRPAFARRMEFKKRGEELVSGQRVWRVTFVERVRPTVVRTLRNEDVPIEGSLWIEPSSGRVVKTLVKTIGAPDAGSLVPFYSAQTMMRVEVTFAPSESLRFWVPDTLTEWARASNGAEISGTATYTRFRRFTVNTTETFDGPP